MAIFNLAAFSLFIIVVSRKMHDKRTSLKILFNSNACVSNRADSEQIFNASEQDFSLVKQNLIII